MRASLAAVGGGSGGGRRRRLHPAGIVGTWTRRRDRRRLHRRVGQRGQRRRRRSRDRDVDPERHRRRPALVRGQPSQRRRDRRRFAGRLQRRRLRPLGRAMCSQDHPDVPTVDAYSLLPDAQAARQRTRLLRPGDRQGRRRTDRRPARRRSIATTPTPTVPTPRRSASQGRRDPGVGARDRPGTPRRVGGGDRARRALPAGQRRHRRQDPGGLRRTRSRRTPTRRLPTWPPCSI